ncbi:uncharacterized protein JN550_001770 [Neoarthrinium moseri]|uniref:uncharacterized protein n=1 Tax=Neoarthrinium moseri TaxID=1658444 RepID=UPI001FDB69D8|nr:uncharacterized protein JN550_001770 [Neoarthrinium moseri]KAI1876274.1 hypothetical protein JN550_001770 [Neoarthrinium moseri]
MDRFHVPSISVAVLKGNETYLDVSVALEILTAVVSHNEEQSFGYAVLPDTPATPDTLYYLASCTKSFTAASLLYTLDNYTKAHPGDRRWSIDSTLREILGEDFALPSDYATHHATPKDALAHRLGLPRCDLSYGGEGYGMRDLIRSLRHLPAFAELRQEWRYFNQGYMLIQAVIQKLSGRWIGDVHREAIWGPLGMDSTVINLTEALDTDRQGTARLAYGYSYNPFTASVDHQPWTDTELVGGGGIISSVSDVAKWVRAFMEGGKGLPLEKKDFEALTRPLMLTTSPGPFEHMSPLLYAMGWEETYYRGHKFVTHSGAVNGYSTRMAFMPEEQWGVVLLSNSFIYGTMAEDAVYMKLMDDFLGVEDGQREDVAGKGERQLQSMAQAWKTSRDRVFPNVSDIPRSLPLKAYAGRYWNDGFRGLELRLESPREFTFVKNREDPVLRADWRRLENITIELEWVSGEQFLAWGASEVFALLGVAVPAEFRIGDDGRVKSLGIYIEPSIIDQKVMVWFDRVGDEVQDMLGEL